MAKPWVGYARPLRDRQGTVIQPGVQVAYNLSGQVALGTVKRLTNGCSAPVFIRPDRTWRANVPSGVSKVKNVWGIVVIGNSERP